MLLLLLQTPDVSMATTYLLLVPKQNHPELTRDQRLRVQTLFFDATYTPDQICLQIGYSYDQICYAIKQHAQHLRRGDIYDEFNDEFVKRSALFLKRIERRDLIRQRSMSIRQTSNGVEYRQRFDG
jgi:hypothetical protein